MSLGVTSFDELNKLVGMKRSMPLAYYFQPMKLTAEQKRERLRLAEKLEDEFVYCMAYMFYAYPNINETMVDEFRNRYIRQLEMLGIATAAARMQANKFSIDAVDATLRHKEDPYYYSKDRARFMAEDQSNFIYDDKDFADAVAAGYAYKTWETVGDNRVRSTHQEVEGLTIPIDEPFQLAGGYMMAPHDDSLGVDENELIKCRCTLSFS